MAVIPRQQKSKPQKKKKKKPEQDCAEPGSEQPNVSLGAEPGLHDNQEPSGVDRGVTLA